MDQFTTFLKDQFSRRQTGPLFGVGIALIIIAIFIGISDNPPGIGLTYLGLVFICFSMLHHWRNARDFGTLLAVAIISFPVMILIHNIFDTINTQIGVVPVVNQLLSGISVMAFVGGVLVAPAVSLVVTLGGLFYLLKKHLT